MTLKIPFRFSSRLTPSEIEAFFNGRTGLAGIELRSDVAHDGAVCGYSGVVMFRGSEPELRKMRMVLDRLEGILPQFEISE